MQSILFLNTVRKRRFFVALLHEDGTIQKQQALHDDYPRAERFFPLVRRVIGKKTVSGIIVVVGPGGFSATRAGVMIGNALAFAWQIPLVGVRMKAEERDQKLIKRGLALLKKKKTSQLLEPYYDKEPNITMK